MTTVRLYLEVRELDEHNRPCMITRLGSRSLVVWDPRNTRLEVTAWLVDNMPTQEQLLLCAGLGITFPLPAWTTADVPSLCYVPPTLRLPGAPALQGGRELVRRAELGRLELEEAAYQAETRGGCALTVLRAA